MWITAHRALPLALGPLSGLFLLTTTLAADVREDVRIPMRDGVELSANIVLPDSEGPFPVVLTRTPYGKGDADDGAEMAERGYAVVIQDCRGTGESAGDWAPVVSEHRDGLDTHEWVLAQPWCNGSIGTTGASYLGHTQWAVAADSGESHKCMFTVVPMIDWYKDCAYSGGAFHLLTLMGWGSEMLDPTKGEGAGIDEDEFDLDEAFSYLPLQTWDDVFGRQVSWMRDWVAHPTYDAYWKVVVTPQKIEQVHVPNITVSGWFDLFVNQAVTYVPQVATTAKAQRARQNQHVIIGPWGHDPGFVPGELNFPGQRIDIEDLQTRWFAHWLRGEDNGIDKLPLLRLYIMGRNEWRDENEWPLARTRYTEYYLHSAGHANTLNGDGALNTTKPADEPADTFTFDPADPVPTNGGQLLMAPPSPRDQTSIEQRDDVLVFTTPLLREDVEVTGPIRAIVYAASTAPDTDFTAKLLDVHPNGKPYTLCDGIVRARYRDLQAEATLIEPGKIYRYEIDLWATSNVFLKGHQIRVEISSSNFPRFDRNPNTGHAFGADAQMQTATQTIYHDSAHPSHIVLPVIPQKAN